MTISTNKGNQNPKFYGYALLAGAVGGAMPSIVNLSFSNQSIGNIAGALLGTSVFMFFGSLVVFFYQEQSMKTALAIGASLPGILQGLTKSNHTFAAELSFSIPMTAQEQVVSPQQLTIIIEGSDMTTPKDTNSIKMKSKNLWISTPTTSQLSYTHGHKTDTIFVDIPIGTRELQITPGGGYDKSNALIIPRQELQKGVVHIRFESNGFWQSFWQSVGNDKVPSYKIELAE